MASGQKLKEALDFQLFKRAADSQFVWMGDAEKQLQSEDIGRDLQGVRYLLKKQEVSDSIPAVSQTTEVFISKKKRTTMM